MFDFFSFKSPFFNFHQDTTRRGAKNVKSFFFFKTLNHDINRSRRPANQMNAKMFSSLNAKTAIKCIATLSQSVSTLVGFQIRVRVCMCVGAPGGVCAAFSRAEDETQRGVPRNPGLASAPRPLSLSPALCRV